MKKIGIFSGTFDPVHLGHIAFAKEACQQAGLERVYFLVEPRPRRKQGVKALEHRVEMVNLAIANETKLGLIILKQARFNVAETLPVLQARFAGRGIYMLLGEDVLSHFAHWPQIEQLTQAVKFIIGIRKHDEAEVKQRIQTVEKVRAVSVRYNTFKFTHNDYSSTAIRHSIKQGKDPVGLDASVYNYIQTVSLYTPQENEL